MNNIIRVFRAQQSFESLKSIFGDNKCFLVKINSHQGPPSDCPDPWLRYLKRHHKSDVPQSDDSAPKTPQDMMSVTSMPSAIHMNSSNLETPPSSDFSTASPSAEVFNHPLSPVQEMGHDIVHSSNLSISTDSLTSQTMNPNVWFVTDYDDAPHGVWLTASDVENIRHFIQDLTMRALVPYVEQLVGALNDSVS
jgi:trafficking protein particle complex subunit 8